MVCVVLNRLDGSWVGRSFGEASLLLHTVLEWIDLGALLWKWLSVLGMLAGTIAGVAVLSHVCH